MLWYGFDVTMCSTACIIFVVFFLNKFTSELISYKKRLHKNLSNQRFVVNIVL